MEEKNGEKGNLENCAGKQIEILEMYGRHHDARCRPQRGKEHDTLLAWSATVAARIAKGTYNSTYPSRRLLPSTVEG